MWIGSMRFAGACLAALVLCAAGAVRAQDEKPTAQQTAAIRACADKNQDDITEAERQCLFELVAGPCQQTPEGQSNVGMADCFRLEAKIWDDLLNANYKALLDELDADQTAKAKAMQRAWMSYRDTTCQFYYDKIQGTMAQMMIAACVTRETARRAMLLSFFSRL